MFLSELEGDVVEAPSLEGGQHAYQVIPKTGAADEWQVSLVFLRPPQSRVLIDASVGMRSFSNALRSSPAIALSSTRLRDGSRA